MIKTPPSIPKAEGTRWLDIAVIGCKLQTFRYPATPWEGGREPAPFPNITGKSEEEKQNENSVEVVKISTSNIISRTKKRRGLVLVQLFIVAGFLALVWFSFGQNVLAPRIQSGGPKQLGDLPLVSNIEGSEALAQIEKLHGTDIELVSAYIAEYVNGNERVTVWVGKAESKEVATALTRRMLEGIEKGGSGFSNLTRLSIAQGYHSHEVFQVDGPGGKHFFYTSRKVDTQVVWLTVEAGEAMPILEQALKNF